MISIFDTLRYKYRLSSANWLFSRMFRVMFGLIFIYVGVNLAGDLVKNKTGNNNGVKSLVYKYDAVAMAESLATDVGNSIAESFDKNGQPTTLKGANKQAQSISVGLEQRFREKIPLAFDALGDITKEIVTPFKQAIKDEAAKASRK